MRYFSTFSGIGGFELGIQQAYDNRSNLRNRTEVLSGDLPDTQESQDGATCIGYSEVDKYATQIYSKHFPNHKNYGDITKIVASTLPDFDMLVGGFPCQSFSVAGKRGGFNDTRGTLFFDVARIIKEKQPSLLLLENVKGLLSHEGGDTFRTIIGTLDELGYDAEWQVLNSKNHGVPQNRERVFIIGHLRGTSRPEVFPFGREDGGNTTPSVSIEQRAQGIATRHLGRNGKLTSKVASTIQVAETPHIALPKINKTIRTGGRGSLTKKHNWDTHLIDGRIRRLTPTECERLQGFPDGWTEGVSDTQRYKTLGNAVTVNVIKDIMAKLF